jgi:hypothetical protein
VLVCVYHSVFIDCARVIYQSIFIAPAGVYFSQSVHCACEGCVYHSVFIALALVYLSQRVHCAAACMFLTASSLRVRV